MKGMSRILLAGFFLAAIPAVQAGVELSEFMAKNETTLATAAGAYADWVEMHNNSGSAVDLAGYYLTDDPADLRKWQFPSTENTSPLAAGGYLLVFVDDSPDSVIGNELHASFKLGAGGEYLALVEPDGETVAYQYNPEYPDQSEDVSYGIDPVMGGLAYFAVPTPGAPNGQAISETVQFSVKGGTFTEPFYLDLFANPDTHYTTNGAIPTADSALYKFPILISGTTRVRARTFDVDMIEGAIVSHTYIHLDASAAAFTSDLPLVVLDNFNAGWMPHTDDGPERQPSELVIFEPTAGVCSLTNRPAITSRAGIRRRGESTGGQAKPNLSVETWGEVDEDSRDIKPLGMPAESDWILYAPYTLDKALIRNVFIYDANNETGRYTVKTRFVEVFLNYDGGSLTASDYFGVYVLMEKIKIDPNRLDIDKVSPAADSEPDISGGYLWKKDKINDENDVFTAGGYNNFNYVSPDGSEISTAQASWLINHINAAKTAIQNGNCESYINVESFADHQIFNMFAKNQDGLGYSTFLFKERNGLINLDPIWDFDRSMAYDDKTSNPAYWGLGTDRDTFFVRMWFQYLRYDADFWSVWLDRWQAIREGPLSDASMVAHIDGYSAELSTAAIRNYERWGGILDPALWAGEVDNVRNYVLARAQWIDDQLIDPPAFNQAGGRIAPGFQLTISGPSTKYYTLDGSEPRASGGSPAGSAYFAPVPITENTLVKARAWDGIPFTQAPVTWPWSPLAEAMFVVDPAPLAITEIMYHPRPPSTSGEMIYTASDFEFIEIQNTSATSCLLVGVQLLNGVEFDLTDATASSLNAGQYGLLVRTLEAFKVRYPSWASLTILGTYSGRLSDGGEQMKMGYGLTDLSPLASFDYEDDWFPCTDGEGFSLVLNDPQSDPTSWDSKSAWRHSSGVDGSPGEANPAPAYAPGTIVINEVLSHQDTDNPGDWIELHNTSGSSINIGGWFLSDSRGDLKKYTLPAGTTIPANGYVVFNEYNHFGDYFALSEHGDSVYLSAGCGGELLEPAYREVEHFGGQERDVTFGRTIRSDGSADFPSMVSATMGYANSAPRVGPVVFEEIMYHPPVGGQEYLILSNTSGSTVPLCDPANPANTWNVSGIDFTFPPGVELTAGDSLLLIRDKMTPAVFRSVYSVPVSIEIFAYSGELDNGAETVVLKKPGTPEAQTGYVPMIVVEQVKYNDSAPWPPEADGQGKSLNRISLMAYANDVANWQAANASYVPTMYTLTVNSGTGDGSYTQGTVVPIQAETVPKHTFVSWAGDVAGILNETEAATTLTMPASNVTVTAMVASNVMFRLTVNAGSGDGEYTAATVVPIEAVQTNLAFVRWIGNVSGIADVEDDSATLTMPAQDITVSALYSEAVTIFGAGADWKYHDKGQNLGTAWQAIGYDDSTWASGAAQLGYNDAGTVTTLDYGGDPENKYVTCYFRHRFVVGNASLIDAPSLELLRDDGAVVYLNGSEAVRDNMPSGTITYSTFAGGRVGGDAEDTFYLHDLSPALLVDGTNVIAVEVHQRTLTSSDVSFAARLTGIKVTDPAIQDGDDDGMYDAWETNYFGATEASLPSGDPDKDGSVNKDEFIAGTLPFDISSFFRINQSQDSEITWATLPGRIYSIYWTDDLAKPFVPIVEDVLGGRFSDFSTSTNMNGFFRVGVGME